MTRKIIVAVHGIGDHHNYATIQTTLNQCCLYYNLWGAVPLGSFHQADPTFLSLQTNAVYSRMSHLAFTEVYWADLPRKIVTEGYTLEEAKRWARTIVDGLHMRSNIASDRSLTLSDADYELLKQVLEEMIETLAVLERLSYLADKAGVFTFDLRKLLDDYLGDVQIVTEFESHRNQILKRFSDKMDDIYKTDPDAEIHIVAHSEGTVVAFLSLLEAIKKKQSDPRTPTWIDRVRGFMTLGSPIDKHLILWPSLWKRFEMSGETSKWKPETHIEWHNYYDYGDPVGFKLDEARAWIEAHGYAEAFDFKPSHDHGFTRYLLPGKAHVDYWNDKGVFKHFIHNVVEKKTPDKENGSQKEGEEILAVVEKKSADAEIPRTRKIISALSFLLPYLGVLAVIWGAVFILYKAVAVSLDREDLNSLSVIFREVTGHACLLYAVTIAVRVPRLTKMLSYRLGSYLTALGLIGLYTYLVINLGNGGIKRLILSVVVMFVASTLSWVFPHWGTKPLLITGGLAVAGITGFMIFSEYFQGIFPAAAETNGERGPLWPVFLATAGFLYLWWLAVLIFDLVFVWRLYIRGSKAVECMRYLVGSAKQLEPVEAIA